MRRLASVVGFVTALAAIALHATQTSRTALCDGIAAQIRGSREFMSGASAEYDPLGLLFRGDHPYLVGFSSAMGRVRSGDDEKAQFLERFRREFAASDVLSRALTQFLDEVTYAELFSRPGSDLHVIVDTAGTAHCQRFLFFQATEGRPAQRVSDPPDKDELCWRDQGSLTRVNGTDVFLEWSSDPIKNHYALKVIPWRDGRWAASCTVAADFTMAYKVANIFVPQAGPLTRADIAGAAVRAVEQRVTWDGSHPLLINGGSPVPEHDLEKLRTMTRLATPTPGDDISLPVFGAEEQLGRTEKEAGHSLQVIQERDAFPLVIADQSYLMVLGHVTIGWRVFPEWLLVVYTLRSGQLEPVASAIVAQQRGALQSLRVTAGR